MLLVPTDIAISERGNKRASSRTVRRHVSGARLIIKTNNEKQERNMRRCLDAVLFGK